MKPQATIRSQINEAEAILRDLKQLSPHARANWTAWAGQGWGAGSGGARATGISNPTEQTALNLAERKDRDRFGREREEHDRHIADALKSLAAAKRLAVSATHTTLSKGPEGCELCAGCTVEGREHPNAWQEVYSRMAPRTEGEFMVKNRPRCSWHYEHAERYGEDATDACTLWHLDHGGRIPMTLVREEHPEAFARVHQQRRAS